LPAIRTTLQNDVISAYINNSIKLVKWFAATDYPRAKAGIITTQCILKVMPFGVLRKHGRSALEQEWAG